MKVADIKLGETYRYRYLFGTGAPEFHKRADQMVTVVRRLGSDEADREVGPMYRIRFPDGFEADAFSGELHQGRVTA